MSDFGKCVVFIVCALGILTFGGPFWAALNRTSLRAGLWMNGITGKEADRLIRFHETGKIDG